jgi:hypothetical protein
VTAAYLPVGVEEPNGLVLVGAGDEVIQLLLIVRSSKNGGHDGVFWGGVGVYGAVVWIR